MSRSGGLLDHHSTRHSPPSSQLNGIAFCSGEFRNYQFSERTGVDDPFIDRVDAVGTAKASVTFLRVSVARITYVLILGVWYTQVRNEGVLGVRAFCGEFPLRAFGDPSYSIPCAPTLTLTPILNSGLSLWGWVSPPWSTRF